MVQRLIEIYCVEIIVHGRIAVTLSEDPAASLLKLDVE